MSKKSRINELATEYNRIKWYGVYSFVFFMFPIIPIVYNIVHLRKTTRMLNELRELSGNPKDNFNNYKQK